MQSCRHCWRLSSGELLQELPLSVPAYPPLDQHSAKEEGVFGPGMALESRYNGCDLIVSRREVSVLEIVRQGVSLDLAGNWKVNTMDRIYYQVLVSPPL